MSFSSLFPVELSDFEYLMYRDDSPRYPMSFCIQVFVSGQLKRDAFQQALWSAFDRHPLLQATVGRRSGRDCWIHHPLQVLPLDWDESPSASVPQPSHLDISKVPGLRLWVRKRENDFVVTWQFHHACCDGIGSLQFVGDVFAHYGISTAADDQRAPKLEKLNVDLLKQRGDLIQADKASSSSTDFSLKTLIRRYRRLVGRKTMPLASPAGQAETEKRPLMLTKIIDAPTLKLLNRYASRQNVHLNSVLLKEMFLTLKDWNEAHRGLKRKQWLRIGMPLNMRMPQHAGIPACNMVSMMFVPRTPEECEDPDELLQGIQKQTIKTLNNRLGNLMLAVIRRMRKIPGLLPWLLGSNRPFTTAILANLGDARKHLGAEFPHVKGRCVAGNVMLEHFDGVAPIRPGTRMAVSLGIYGRRLIINMNCDQNYLSHSESEQLLDSFVSRVESLVSEESEH